MYWIGESSTLGGVSALIIFGECQHGVHVAPIVQSKSSARIFKAFQKILYFRVTFQVSRIIISGFVFQVVDFFLIYKDLQEVLFRYAPRE